jgi:hypothetical protein
MKTVLKRMVARTLVAPLAVVYRSARKTLAKPAVALCAYRPCAASIQAVRALNGIQLSTNELGAIVRAVKGKAPCTFLVFGLGNDSKLWLTMNRGGTTVFLEDDPEWFRISTAADRRIQAYLIDYHSQRAQWQQLLDSASVFDLVLPAAVAGTRWDVVLVDAPGGNADSLPGRMKSIAAASRLVKDDGDVFVHDCDRQVERVYCDRFLRETNFVTQVDRLRHYRMANREALIPVPD